MPQYDCGLSFPHAPFVALAQCCLLGEQFFARGKMRTTFTISLNPIADSDIIIFLQGMTPVQRNKVVRDIIREHMNRTDDQILQILKDIKRFIETNRAAIATTRNDNEMSNVAKEHINDNEIDSILSKIDSLGL